MEGNSNNLEIDKVGTIAVLEKSPLQSVEQDGDAVFIDGYIKHDKKTLSASELLSLYREKADVSALYPELSGSFWFAIFDAKSQSFIICNDHLGSKPVYYRQHENGVVLSSSLKTLKKESGVQFELCNQAIYNYVFFHCIPAPYSIYQNTFKLEAGTAITFNAKGVIKELVYNPEFNTDSVDQQHAQKKCLTIIKEIVGDVATDNCGAFLSGGLDSSTVAGMLASHQDKAKTFSIGFTAKDYDETHYAKITANHFKTDHKVFYLEPDDAAKEFVKVAQYFDEPFGNSSSLAAYFCAKFAKQNGVNKLLAGDGGDELFAGNERYAKQKQFELFFKLPSFIRSLMTSIFTLPLFDKIPGFSKLSSYIKQANVRLPSRLHTYNFVQRLGDEAIFSQEFLQSVDSSIPIQELERRYHAAQSDDSVDKMLFLDWKFTLADNDLVKVSKMCELAEVDVEYPLLDKALVEFSCTVPAEVKLPSYQLRDFYKKACKGFLADETLTKSKHGFGLPFGVWMKENETLKNTAMDALTKFKQRGIVSDSLIEQALKSHENVHASYYGELIWILVVLELWLQGNE